MSGMKIIRASANQVVQVLLMTGHLVWVIPQETCLSRRLGPASMGELMYMMTPGMGMYGIEGKRLDAVCSSGSDTNATAATSDVTCPAAWQYECRCTQPLQCARATGRSAGIIG